MMYRQVPRRHARRKSRLNWKLLFVPIVFGFGFLIYTLLDTPTPQEQAAKIEAQLKFGDGFTQAQQKRVIDAIAQSSELVDQDIELNASIHTTHQDTGAVLDIFVPVTNFNAARQDVTLESFQGNPPKVLSSSAEESKFAVSKALGIDAATISTVASLDEITDADVVFIPIGLLSYQAKLLSVNESYYLDGFDSGAVFVHVVADDIEKNNILTQVSLLDSPDASTTLSYHQTGVTALTRIMLQRLNAVGNPTYFSEKIGPFLSNADITHISNEVSFKEDCGYNNTLFCSDPRFIETLKASGVDVVELTGNHNNDVGSEYNAATIAQYRQLGWSTVGGGLNTQDAALPYLVDQKESKVTLLAYNFPDSPNGGAIAGVDRAGANSFSFDRIATDITTAKSASNFVIVNVQYWECYAYPDGYLEFPECDTPIGEQEANFKKLIDLGADMVVGTSAHQPQTYELYKEKPIYYGLGNLYFDQTSWPGTERGIILTHYFYKGVLLQTRLTPTEYGKELQTDRMSTVDAEWLLGRLAEAR